MFFSEYCEISKSFYFEEHLQTAAQVLSCEFCEIFKKSFLQISYLERIPKYHGDYQPSRLENYSLSVRQKFIYQFFILYH